MHVCDEFIKEGLPVVAIPASSFMTAIQRHGVFGFVVAALRHPEQSDQ